MTRAIVAIISTFVLSGCAPYVSQLESISQAADDAAPTLDKAQREAYEACLELPTTEEAATCGEHVKRQWEPVGRLYRVIRTAACAADVSHPECMSLRWSE